MQWETEGICVLVLVVLLAWHLVVGLKACAAKTIKHFAVGNGVEVMREEMVLFAPGHGFLKRTKITHRHHRFSVLMLLATIYATDFSAQVTIGAMEKVYTMGMTYMCLIVLIPLFWMLTSKIFTKNLEKFKDCISLGDVMYKLYGNTGLWMSNICSLIMGLIVLSIQCTAIGILCEQCLNIPPLIGMIIMMSIVVIYSLGGVRRVVITDVVQFFSFTVIMFFGIMFGLYDIGGIGELIHKLPKNYVELHIDGNNASLFFSILFFRFIPATYGPYVQRYLMAESGEQLRKTLFRISFVDLFLNIMIYTIGLVVVVRTSGFAIGSDTVLSYFINNCVPYLLKSFMIAGMFAIIMSTADSWLNNMAVLMGHDIYSRLGSYKGEDVQVEIGRKMTCGIAIVAICAAYCIDSIVNAIWMAYNFWEPLVMIPLCAGFMGIRTAEASYQASVMGGIFGVYMGYMYVGELGTVTIASGVICNVIAFSLVHQFVKKYRPHLIPAALVASSHNDMQWQTNSTSHDEVACSIECVRRATC